MTDPLKELRKLVEQQTDWYAERDRLTRYNKGQMFQEKVVGADLFAILAAWERDRLIATTAKAFIDSHVADPDITKEMREAYAAYQAALNTKGQP